MFSRYRHCNALNYKYMYLIMKNSEITDEYDSNLAAICHNGTFVGTQKDNVVSFKSIP